MGETNTRRSTGRPWLRAKAVAVAPREWATTARAGPCAATTAARASANSRMLLRPGPSGPGPEPPWLGASKATTRNPASTSGPTNGSSCQCHPPHPCTRYTAGGSPWPRAPSGGPPQSSPATVWPSTCTWNGCPGVARWARWPRVRGTPNQRVSAQRAPADGAICSSSLNDRTIVLFLRAVRCLEVIEVSSGGWAGGEQQRLEGAGGAGGGVRVAEQAAGVVVGQHHAVEVVGELRRVGVGAEVALGDA